MIEKELLEFQFNSGEVHVGYIGPFNSKYQRKGFRAITPTGVLGEPRLSTKEAGEKIIEKVTDMYLATLKLELE